jgi:hypothetical protein
MGNVYLRRSGQWVPPDGDSFNVWAYTKGSTSTVAWREVLAGYVYDKDAAGKLVWKEVFNKYQAPPTNVRGVTPTVNGGTLTWNAAPSATHYQVRLRTGVWSPTGTYTVVTTPTGDWTPNLSLVITGREADHEYHYTVVARRATPGAAMVDSIESARATLNTGHDATPRVGTNEVVTVQPSKTDSWSSDSLWGQTTGNVQQGYATNSARNSHGAVAYSTAYTQLASKLNTTYVDPVDGKTKPVPVVDHITLSNAVITRVYRSSTTGTDFPGSQGNFTAPDTGEAKENFKFLNPDDTSENKLLTWARTWVKATRSYDGILIFRTDGGGNATAGYNGLCTFRGNTYSTDWQLTLTVSWNFNLPEKQNPTWTPGG